MLTKESFLMPFNGHCNRYSSYLIVGKTADEVIEAIKKIDPNEECVGSGAENNGNVYFEIGKGSPYFIRSLTAKLHCVGFAETSWDENIFIAAKDGVEYNDYIAKADDISFDDYKCLWNAFVEIVDIPSGATFNIGSGCVDFNTMKYYTDIIVKHSEKEMEEKKL